MSGVSFEVDLTEGQQESLTLSQPGVSPTGDTPGSVSPKDAAMHVRQAFVVPSVTSEQELIRYGQRICPTYATTIHLHEFSRDGYRVACQGYGCYTILPNAKR